MEFASSSPKTTLSDFNIQICKKLPIFSVLAVKFNKNYCDRAAVEWRKTPTSISFNFQDNQVKCSGELDRSMRYTALSFL